MRGKMDERATIDFALKLHFANEYEIRALMFYLDRATRMVRARNGCWCCCCFWSCCYSIYDEIENCKIARLVHDCECVKSMRRRRWWGIIIGNGTTMGLMSRNIRSTQMTMVRWWISFVRFINWNRFNCELCNKLMVAAHVISLINTSCNVC